MNIRHRVTRLERSQPMGADGECPRAGLITCVVRDDQPVPEYATPCELCGQDHFLYVHEILVHTREEAQAALREESAED